MAMDLVADRLDLRCFFLLPLLVLFWWPAVAVRGGGTGRVVCLSDDGGGFKALALRSCSFVDFPAAG